VQEEKLARNSTKFDLNCGYENENSTPFDNNQFTSLTNNSENSVIELPKLFINGENQSTSNDEFIVEDTINDLVTGRLKPQDLPIIRICLNEDNQYISANNRRLYCYQQAIQKGANFKKVLVRIVRETNEGAGFGWKRKKSLKIIENKIWNNVVVSHLARPNKICRENGE
ncbi:7250_t:CDS:2, partial [Gigaspora rosea]